MKKIVICALIIILMSSCSGDTTAGADLIKEKYKQLEACTMSVDISADFGDRISEYSVTYKRTADKQIITIEKPIEIAGITASITDGSNTLSYDGLILETGKLAGTALTPIDAIPTMLATWGGGYMTDSGTEKLKGVKCYRLTYRTTIEEKVIEQQAWFEAESLKPVRAETLVDGQRVIACEFTQVDW